MLQLQQHQPPATVLLVHCRQVQLQQQQQQQQML
jgi:hypothetical protein